MTTPLGEGYAIILEANGHDYYWTVALSNGALVTFTQDRVRIQDSYTYRRGVTDAAMAKVIAKPEQP